MNTKQAIRHRLAAAFALVALLLAAATIDVRSTAHADDGEPDYLVLNPKGE